MAILTLGKGVSVNLVDLPSSGAAPAVTGKTTTHFALDYGDGFVDDYTGTGFTYGTDGRPNGGTITGNSALFGAVVAYTLTELSVSVSAAAAFYATGNFAGIQKLILAGDDHLIGGDYEDGLRGWAGDDTLDGGAGDDLLYGDEGNDKINGGAGIDTAGFDAAFANFTLTLKNGLWTIADKRPVGLGTDLVGGVELFKFSDRTLDLRLVDVPTRSAYNNILRVTGSNEAPYLVANGVKTAASALTEIMKAADATTTVATFSYQFFTGKLPSQAGLDFLVSPDGTNGNNLNSAYYQSFNLENRYINFAVNLGKVGEGKAAFAATYGGLSLFDATREAYKTIFGGAPTDAKIHAMIDTRVDYFAGYGGDGPEGIGTKAAMVGWLLAEAAKADIGQYAKASENFLTGLASNASGIFEVSLVGHFGATEYNYSG